MQAIELELIQMVSREMMETSEQWRETIFFVEKKMINQRMRL